MKCCFCCCLEEMCQWVTDSQTWPKINKNSAMMKSTANKKKSRFLKIFVYPLAWHPKESFPGEVTSFNVYFGAQSLINSFIYALLPPAHLQWLKWKLSLVLLCVTLTCRSPLPEFRMNCSLNAWLPWIGNTLLWKLWKENHWMLSDEILQEQCGVHFQAVGQAPSVQSNKQESQTWVMILYSLQSKPDGRKITFVTWTDLGKLFLPHCGLILCYHLDILLSALPK